MRIPLNKIGAFALAVLLAAALPCGAQAAAKSRKEKRKSEAAPAPKKPTAYEKLFRDKPCKTADGLFKLHLVEGKLYTEIPLRILEREFVVNISIEESSQADYGLAGQQPLPPYHITFSLKDSTVRMHEVPQRALADGDAGIEKALAINSAQPIVASYPVKAYNADSTAVVIENTALFQSGNEHLKAFEPRGMSPLHISTAAYKPDLSLLRDVEGGEEYASVVSDMTYGVTTQYFIFIVCRDKPFTVRARRTVTMLPERLARARIADPRIGVLPVPFMRFTTARGSEPAYFAARIDFRPDGEIRPVTLYIDTLFAPAWQEGIRRGIGLWNEAFRRIGMGDVLRCEAYPRGAFDSNNPRGFYVKYVASTSTRPTVNLVTDPRSGEITGGRIHLPENLADEIRARRFIDLSAVDPSARDTRLDAEELASSVAIYTARGMAQLLGLATNYAGASAYPTDSLRSASFTRKNGLCSSITALNSYNYLAQPGDEGVRLVNDCLGTYDYFAIRWLYGDIPGARTPAEEQQALSEMLREKAGDPAYYYGNYWYDYYFGDVRLAYYNLGDDPALRTRYRLKNLRLIAEHAAEWLEGRDPDGSYRAEAVAAIATGVREMISYLAAYIGGSYYTETAEGDGQTMLRVVPKADQRRYVQETLRALEDLAWLDTPLAREQMTNLSESVLSDCMMSLMKRLETLPRYQNGLPGAYTPAEMAADMARYIFRDVKAGRRFSDYNRQLQREFTAIVIGGSKVLAQPKSGAKGTSMGFADAQADAAQAALRGPETVTCPVRDGDAVPAGSFHRSALPGLNGLNENLMPPVFPYEAALTEAPVSAYGKYRMRYYAKDFSEHLYYGMLLDLRDTYRRGVSVAQDPSSRDFCRFMLRKIEDALKTD